ncbi:MAG: hypothetical protein NTU98_08055 [Bacteroidetes bacterium]|nr:hypothetical protein [Bacteroidota bacterium]
METYIADIIPCIKMAPREDLILQTFCAGFSEMKNIHRLEITMDLQG